ncbi:anthrax toxin lethal factor-related metalloendopeptidase, partial [Bacillus thuringiensis]
SATKIPQQLILVQTSGNYDQQEASNMIQRISNIDSKTLYALYNKNIRIKLINFPITYLPEYSYLRGQVPRGWEGTGYTWDSVPGIGGNPVVARIGYSNYGNMHTSVNLELHETAHAIDRYVFQNISYSQDFLRIHAYEYNSFSNSSYYYYPEEYFAEAYAYYYLNSSTHEILKTRAPYTYRFIQNLPFYL